MTEITKNGLLALWPMVLVVGNSFYNAGTMDSELETLKLQGNTLNNLVPRVAVLESQTSRMSDDLVEIKTDIKLIRDFLLEGNR